MERSRNKRPSKEFGWRDHCAEHLPRPGLGTVGRPQQDANPDSICATRQSSGNLAGSSLDMSWPGSVALLAGPLQFSSRVHRRSPSFHRVLGRAYVVAVFFAAPLGVVPAYHRHDPHAMHWLAAVTVQRGTWMLTTGAAFLTVWNGHYQRHREWVVRSYAVTFTFVGTRVLQPIPAWNRYSEATFAMEVIMITFLAVLVPDIAVNWRGRGQRRVRERQGTHHASVRFRPLKRKAWVVPKRARTLPFLQPPGLAKP